MTRIVPNRLGEPRYEDEALIAWSPLPSALADKLSRLKYPDEYWHDEDASPVRHRFLWPALWIAAVFVTVYALIMGAVMWWT